MTVRERVRRSGTGRRPGGRLRPAWAALSALTVVLTVAGCTGLSGSTSPGPVATPTPTVPDDATMGPSATFWPTQVIEGSISLAAADASFSQMNKDVTNAVDSADPHTMLTVMTDALKFLKTNRLAITYLQGYEPTKDTGDKLAAAYDQMIGGAQRILDGLTAGNGEAVQQGFNDFFAGDAAYAEMTGPLGDLASQATLMKRNYTQ